MKLKWRMWANGTDIEGFLKDNGLTPVRWNNRKTKEYRWAFVLKDGTVLGGVKMVTELDGKTYFVSYPNISCFRKIQRTDVSHKNIATAVKEALLISAPYFNVDGTHTNKTFIPGDKPVSDSGEKIRMNEWGDMLDTEGEVITY